jgi:transcriptional regulator with XRE-family HTH domain
VLIQKLRLKRGWSQEQLAELSGLSVRTIQRVERGESASTASLKSLAAVFEVDFSHLHPEPDMSTNTSTNPSQGVSPEEALALRHVRKTKGFYTHLFQYCVVISVLAIFNLVQMPGRLWVVWVAAGWGATVLFHWLSAFDKIPFFGAEWEKRQVEKRLGRTL